MYEKTRLLDSFCYFCESLHGIMDERRKIEEPVSAEFERFNKDFEASLRSETTRLQSAIDVILNSTGKHVRPLLVLLTAKVCGQVTDNTINSAVLLELLHTATLIHDDVIDETKQRRGVPSLNAIFDNRISVLVGDYVLSTALIRSIQTGDLRIVGIISNLGRDFAVSLASIWGIASRSRMISLIISRRRISVSRREMTFVRVRLRFHYYMPCGRVGKRRPPVIWI